jgi:hemolysin III
MNVPRRHPSTAHEFVGRFHHSKAERIADGIVHGIGLVAAIVAGAVLLALAVSYAEPGEYVATIFYVVSLVAVLSISMVYNQWPVSPAKWILRRLDHSAIYLLIAGTYTPFLAQLDDRATAAGMIAFVWTLAALGIALKLAFPGRFDRIAVVFYIAIGWSGALIGQPLVDTLPPSTLWFIVAGGLVYTAGVVFYAWQSLRYQNAVWHGFVVVAAGLHMTAVMDCLVIDRL